MFTLTKRQKDIVNYLLKTKKISTVKDIASVFGVSERTIRYDLDIIELWLDERNIVLIRKPGTGIFIDTERVDIANLLEELADLNNIDYATEERQFYIKLILFLSTDYITLENISDIVNVSRNTVIQDLDRIEEELKESNFVLKRKTYYGIKVIGKESEIRHETLKLIWNGLRDGLLNNKDIKSIFGSINEDLIIKAIKEKEKLLDIAFTEEATKELMLHIGIVTKRVKEGKHIEYLNTLKDDFKKSKYYKTTKASLSIIEENCNIIFNDNEILYVDRIFKGAKTRDSIVFGEECEDISVIVEETIEDVEKYLGINLKNDIEFINALKTHLQIAFFRLNNNLDIENPLTEQIKYRYPFIFELSRKILDKHKEAFGGKLVDEEIAYMAMHIGAAFERNKSSSFMPNVLLVCGSGLATSNLLKTRLSVMLPELRYIGPISTIEVDKYLERNHVDFIISTSPVEVPGVDVIQINPLVDNEDLNKLKTLIFKNTVRKQLYHISNMDIGNMKEKYYLGELFNKEDIVFKTHCNNWREAIRIASKPLIDKNCINSNYAESIIKAVEELGPYMVFIPEVALAHASSHPDVLKDAMSMLILKEGIRFGDKGDDFVRIIIVLASISSESYMDKLIKLVDILEKRTSIDNLIKANKFEDIMYLSN